MSAGEALAIWAIRAKLSFKEIAAKVSASQVTVSRWRTGKAKPSRDKAYAIELLTEGAVPVPMWSANDNDGESSKAA